MAYTRFKTGKDIMDALVLLRKKKGAGGREKQLPESQSWRRRGGMFTLTMPGSSRNRPSSRGRMVNVIVVVCAAFGLTVSEAKTEIMSLRTKGMPESTAIFSVEEAGEVHNQTNEFVYLVGNVNHNADLSAEVDRHIRNAWCSFRKYTLELYDRPSAPLELKNRMLKADVLETIAVRLRHVEPARVPLRHAAPSPPQLTDSLHRLAKEQSR